ncbi:AAA family ATPase [Leucobacter soli]|uniref:AAA family ATPase n=1 Tax=Leucobacter soli TaxID=2812850 RepID=UPI00361ED34A
MIAALRARLAAGCAVLVAEHRPEALEALASEVAVQRLEMREGSLQPGPAGGDGAVSGASDGVRAPASTCSATAPSGPSIAAGPDRAEGHRIVLLVDHVVERGGRELLRVPELSASPGEIVVLGGPNGSGKTSLLEDIALPGSSGRAPGIALVPHRVDDLLIRDTLADECRYADRRSGAERGATAARFARLIAGSIPGIASRPEPVSERDTDLSGAESAPSLGVLATTHPRDLSAGTRLVLGIAVQLASAPRTLLLDEPTRGLDAAACERLAGILVELTAADAAEGTAVVIATHDTDFADRLAAAGARTRRLRLIDGRLS